ncbi:MAG TPA: CBS domain-containing protein [Alphaproteobacteria bacterium]|jgi:CBS domain-containing protein|nr:CBS domain-containing protein [Alphaproteobacteria bacterium]
MKVEDILRVKGRGVITTRPTVSVKAAADRLRLDNIAALVVMHDDQVVGIVSEREIVRAYSRDGAELGARTVGDIMAGIVAVSPEDGLRKVMATMTRLRARHVVVLKDGGLAGIISIGDVVKHRLSDLELEASVLRDAYLAAH